MQGMERTESAAVCLVARHISPMKFYSAVKPLNVVGARAYSRPNLTSNQKQSGKIHAELRQPVELVPTDACNDLLKVQSVHLMYGLRKEEPVVLMSAKCRVRWAKVYETQIGGLHGPE